MPNNHPSMTYFGAPGAGPTPDGALQCAPAPCRTGSFWRRGTSRPLQQGPPKLGVTAQRGHGSRDPASLGWPGLPGVFKAPTDRSTWGMPTDTTKAREGWRFGYLTPC